MVVYFHGASCGFYIEEIHGPRLVLVSDPQWEHPTISIPDPNWVPEGLGDFEPPLVDVLDPQACPPKILVANPKCSLPPENELVEITEAQYLELLTLQSEGKVICSGVDGLPLSADRPPPSAEEVASRERVWRDAQLAATDPLVVRHRDEVEADNGTTLLDEQYKALQVYRLSLRDYPGLVDFPNQDRRPIAPEWLSEAVQ
ncbi:MAG: phage tail assembly chaperone [Pseudomonadota bacterium]